MNENQNNNSSMLDSIITTPTKNNEESLPTESSKWIDDQNNWNNWNKTPSNNPNTQKNPKKKMSPADILRIFWALFFAWAVLFWAFISFIVFNPTNAQFFTNFWIDPQQIKNYIWLFVNASFWIMTIILSIVSMIFLFTAFVTKKEYAKKKTIATILSIFSIVILFAEITFWIYLTSIIWATNYLYLNWWVIIRDNDKLMSKKFNDWTDIINNFDNLIWPISMKFDLSVDVEYFSKIMNIKWYRIDFDWDKKFDKEWTNPAADQDIIFDYQNAWSYTPVWEYYWTNSLWEEITQPIRLPNINIAWIVKIEEKKERLWWKSVKFDISDIKKLWKVDFYLQDKNWDFSTPDANYNWTDTIYSPLKIFNSEAYICLVIINNQKSATGCDKIFIIWAESKKSVDASIEINRDPINPLWYNLKINLAWQITSMIKYSWIIDWLERVSDKEMVDYNFDDYWKHIISVKITEPSGNEYTIEKEIDIKRPLNFSLPSNTSQLYNNSLIKIIDKSWNNLTPESYVRELWEYHIPIRIPSDIKFDSNYVKVTDNYYSLKQTEWDFNWDWVYEKIWNDITNKFYENKKTTVNVRYTFYSNVKRDTQTIEEKIILEADKNDISVKLDIKQETDYAPAIVHFDWSASSVKEWSLVKFIYDFWEWKAPVEWDSKQDYRYNYPWEYDVVFTVTKEDWMKDSIKKKIIVKEKWKEVVINTSVSSWYAWKQIDFDAVWTIGQISTYSWSFWDWSISSESTPVHTYKSSWDYIIKLVITFTDWIIKSWNKEITIK